MPLLEKKEYKRTRIISEPCSVCSYTYSMNFIIDIQAFGYQNYQYLPKEVAVLAVNKNYSAHWFVSPPVPHSALKKSAKLANSWLTDNHHGIDWIEVGISLHHLQSNLRRIARVASTVIVYSKEAAEYLEDIIGRNIICLEKDPEVPSLCQLKSKEFCIYHGVERSQIYRCALSNVYKIREFLLQNGKATSDTAIKTHNKSLKKSSILSNNDKSTQTSEDTDDYSEVYETATEAEEPQYI